METSFHGIKKARLRRDGLMDAVRMTTWGRWHESLHPAHLLPRRYSMGLPISRIDDIHSKDPMFNLMSFTSIIINPLHSNS